MIKIPITFLAVLLIILILMMINDYQTKRAGPIFLSPADTILGVYFSGSTIYIDSEGSYLRYDTSKGGTTLHDKQENFILGAKDVSIISCYWENFSISSLEQTATKLDVRTVSGGQLHSINTNKTVRPIYCDDKKVLLSDNYPNSPNRKYIWETSSDDFVETTEYSETDQKEEVFGHNIFRYIYSDDTDSRHILIDYNNGIWYSESLEGVI